ncbi:MAG: DUF732 domain-containing protein [Mycobacterium sp.]|nr:DUF732 domain-containing protein [Mycobacterium sp.]
MRTGLKLAVVGLLGGASCAGLLGAAPAAQADQLGYLINVTVRPTYNFPNAQTALDYGYGLCGRIESKASFTDMAAQIKNDFNTNDEFTVSYLLSQAAQELCPAQTWQLRQSAAGYRPTGPV